MCEGYVLKQTLDQRILPRRDRAPPPRFEIPWSVPSLDFWTNALIVQNIFLFLAFFNRFDIWSARPKKIVRYFWILV